MPHALEFTDENGQYNKARAHDATLISLDFVANEFVLLKFRRPDGTKVAIRLEDVREYYFGPLWDCPILLDIFLWSVDKVPKSDMIDVGWNALFQHHLIARAISDEAKKVIARNPDQLLVVLGYVHGTSMAVVCRDLLISDLQQSAV